MSRRTAGIATLVVGVVLGVAGLVMVPLPGPGWLLVAAAAPFLGIGVGLLVFSRPAA